MPAAPPYARPSVRGAKCLPGRGTEAHPAAFCSVIPLSMREVPMLGLAACFVAGALLVHFWQPPLFAVLTAALLLMVAALAIRWAPRTALAATAVAWVSLGWTCALLVPVAPAPSVLRLADGSKHTLEGRVTRIQVEPQPLGESPKNALANEQDISVDVESLRESDNTGAVFAAVNGGIRLSLYAPQAAPIPKFRCGDRLSVLTRLHAPEEYRDPGVWNRAAYLARSGIALQGSVPAAAVAVLGHDRPSLSCEIHAAQQWISSRISAYAGSKLNQHLPAAMRIRAADVAILQAMLAGDRTSLDQPLRTDFERTGSFHLFVVSGMHVALLVAAAYWVLLRFGVPPPAASVGSLLLAFGYAVLTGFGQPVQRALGMAALVLLARVFYRRSSSLNALGIAALGIAMFDPASIRDAGFLMTVLAIFAIAGVAAPIAGRTIDPYLDALRDLEKPRLDSLLQPRLAQFRCMLRMFCLELGLITGPRFRNLPVALVRWGLRFVQVAIVSFVAEAIMALPMAVFFHRATPFAGPTNLLVLPLVGIVLLCAAVSLPGVLLHPAVALLPISVTMVLLHGIEHVVHNVAALQAADVRVPTPGLAFAIAASSLWAMAALLARTTNRRALAGAAALLLAGTAVALAPGKPQLLRDHLELTALDVGQGDSVLVGSPQQQAMLIDAGGPSGFLSQRPVTFDTGEEVVSPYLWSRGIRRIDVAVLTHAHSDHIAGMAAVLRNFRPRELWVSVDAHSAAFRDLLDEAHDLGTTVRFLHAGDHIAWSGTQIDVLSPSPAYQPEKMPKNDDSLVLRIAYGKSSLLEEGDAEAPSERLLEASPIPPVTLLKVAHHGSHTSTSADLLAWAHPPNAVISCGKGNTFGHPREEVLQRLQADGVRTSRTDTMGAVQFLMDRDGSIATHTFASNP